MKMNSKKNPNKLSGLIFTAMTLLFIGGLGEANAGSPLGNWETENVGRRLNTSFHDAFATLTTDGLTMYFASDRPGGFGPSIPGVPWPFASYDIYVTHRRSLHSRWSEPVNLGPTINTSGTEHSVTLTPDEHFMIFSSDRPGGCGWTDIWVSYRSNVNSDLDWEEPQHVPCLGEANGINGPFLDSCPNLYFNEDTGEVAFYFITSSGSNGFPDPSTLDIQVSSLDLGTMTFGEPQDVPNVTTPYEEGHFDPYHGYIWAVYPYPDGSLNSKGDIWMSQRTEDGWSFAVNLGPQINTPYEEQLPAPEPDGQTIFFPSDRPGGFGGLDIYEATFIPPHPRGGHDGRWWD
jgi:hypothetical protein